MGDVITFIIWAAVIQGLFLGLFFFLKKQKARPTWVLKIELAETY